MGLGTGYGIIWDGFLRNRAKEEEGEHVEGETEEE